MKRTKQTTRSWICWNSKYSSSSTDELLIYKEKLQAEWKP